MTAVVATSDAGRCLANAHQCRAAALRSERPYVAETFRRLAQEWVAEGKFYRDMAAGEVRPLKGSAL